MSVDPATPQPGTPGGPTALAPAPEDGPGAPPPPARRRGTLRDLIWSLLAVVGIVVVLVFLVPRPQTLDQPAADVDGAARQASGMLGFDVAVPAGLPQGWRATQAEVREAQGLGVSTWRVTFLTPGKGWASVVQASEYSVGWEKREVSGGPAAGTVDVDGVSWTRRDLAERARLSLVHRDSGPVTTIVTCACQEAELLTLVRSLTPQPGR